MTAYYNDNDPVACHVLRELIHEGILPPGEVDDRSIKDVRARDLRGFEHHHFFAGMGGWAVAARAAGWPDSYPLWTASCPCQPFSVIGQQAGFTDPRDLWTYFYSLVGTCRPACIVGEQVASEAGYAWFDRTASDLAKAGYARRAVDIPACAVDAPHLRPRLYWAAVNMGDPFGAGLEGQCGNVSGEARRWQQGPGRSAAPPDARSCWEDAVVVVRDNGKAYRTKPGLRLLAHGVARRIDLWRLVGNGLVLPLATQVLASLLEEPEP